VGGPVKYLTPSAQAPMTVCVVCYEMRAAKAICPMCGRPAGSLS
jgi:rRNA maturation endonuclease Nob1